MTEGQNLIRGISADYSNARGRIQFIDAAKGVAILAVIVGHSSIRLSGISRGASLITALCFTFHMPLFFFLSGYFLHCDRAFNFRKEFKRLVVPYILTAIVIVLLACLTTEIFGDYPLDMTKQNFALGWINAALYGSANITGKELWQQQFRIGAVWFLLALFWARLVVTSAYKLRHPGIAVACWAITGVISARYIWLPLSIQAGLSAAIYVYLGTIARRHDFIESRMNSVACLISTLLVWLYAIVNFNGFGMGLADFGAMPIDIVRNVVGSLAGMYVVIYVSKIMCKHFQHFSRLLEKVGRLSLLVLAVHIIDDDVTRIDAINQMLLGAGLGAFWIVTTESIVRCVYTVCIAFCLDRLRVVRSIFS